ncbi:MAG TPA: pilin [Candidatus Paceibacterota bacterium]|nr:pilin [Candidatus Paceibacterota bacterium]
MKNVATAWGRKAGAALGALLGSAMPLLVFAQSSTFNNPAKDASFQAFIADFLKAIVEISLPILTLFIVYAGFKFVFARGNPDGIKEAKRNFLYVILGAILILGAWVLATLIASTATQVLGGS